MPKSPGDYFESKVSDCLAQNQERSGKAQVPDIAIYATIKKLVLPSYGEKFDRLFYVRIAENFTFEVNNDPQRNLLMDNQTFEKLMRARPFHSLRLLPEPTQ